MKKMPSPPFNNVSISYYEDKTNSYPKKYYNQIVSFVKKIISFQLI